MTKVNRLNRFVKKNNDFIRRFSAGVKIIELDSSGRILIPKDLLLFGGIESDLVLASAVDIIEIWDKSAYEQSVSNDAGDFGTLAEEVMGELKYDEPDVS
jgi:MraZ protein